ncbi:alpha-(1,3)-fucosyltransferase fut-6-like [Mercenaria mercenaria]|uniref:alpha-(1,3)-fucosyltransferase fut-6-like n=1 Tax=Mercenaria mercenaria TaxID=6596 RepID=UPI00234EE7CE|nr:alpha-(1,3)-fucosyltransferase fut-6-like [Mercenaria mercenaria]XP_045199427.2 alpha-(1,3)-fucosyltransferase fut-6-like [Mercenaria mercenaria]XP_045199428.2 alpha-(1,3)-fucosyltransferase fut-6-like [Mercenaria mercenaria]
MPTRKSAFALICCVTSVLMIMINVVIVNIEPSVNMHVTYDKRNFSQHIVKHNTNFWRKKDLRKIVVWTTFFDSWDWVKGIQIETENCPMQCEVTKEKSEVDSADAVLFHVSDMWKYRGFAGTIYNRVKPMPHTRTHEQVWVLLSWEPITKFYGKMEHTFNWTITYRRDSTIRSVYTAWVRNKTSDLKSSSTSDMTENIFQTKTKFIATAISNCFDRAKRYEIIRELEKYVKIDKFGRCYGERFPNLDFLGDYKFYIAIENTLCRDYITEKYWNTLNRKQIPVIATTKYNTELLPPGSFINVFDFDSIESLADELIKIENNETLYNSFFEWRKEYTRNSEGIMCKLCKELHANKSAQSYVDMEEWVRDDICSKSTTWSLINEAFQRLLFNLGMT